MVGFNLAGLRFLRERVVAGRVGWVGGDDEEEEKVEQEVKREKGKKGKRKRVVVVS